MQIRTATASDIDAMLDWAAAEGWNPGLDDAAAFQAADPDGFFMGYSGDRPIAAVCVVNHSDRFAFLGLYIVAPGYRGAGHGKALWDAALAHAGGRTVGLDGVPDQQANYTRSGFVRAGATARHSGQASGRMGADIGPVTPVEIEQLIAQEARQSGVAKPAYLRGWYAGAPTRQTYVLRSGAALLGHVTLRACRDGHKIGPLCADTPQAAEALLDHSLAVAQGPVSIDVPETAPTLAALCRDRGLSVGFETARMYRGPAPMAARPDPFAVATLELG